MVSTGSTLDEQASPRERFATFLFLAVFVFLWVTINPYVDPVLKATATVGEGVSSNLLNQICVITLTGMLFAFAASSRVRPMLFQPRGLVCMIFIWYLVVSLLSPHPVDAAKRTILAAMTCANASIFLLLPRSERDFARLLTIGSFVMLAFAYFGIVFLPTRAIHQASDVAEPMLAGFWRGQYSHKNIAAAVMLVSIFFSLFIHANGYRKSAIAIGALSLLFLAQTGGKSATAMLPVILILGWFFERWAWTRIPIAVIGIAIYNFLAIGAASSSTIRDTIELFGVDPTFTNRIDIWKLALDAIGQSPIIGYGFQGFWQSDELVFSGNRLETWAVNAFNGHNAYIDTLLTTGFPGLVLTLAWLFVMPLRYMRDYGTNSPALTRLFMRIWLYGMYAGCLESVFFQSGSPVWFAMMFSIFGLRMQAHARLVE